MNNSKLNDYKYSGKSSMGSKIYSDNFGSYAVEDTYGNRSSCDRFGTIIDDDSTTSSNGDGGILGLLIIAGIIFNFIGEIVVNFDEHYSMIYIPIFIIFPIVACGYWYISVKNNIINRISYYIFSMIGYFYGYFLLMPLFHLIITWSFNNRINYLVPIPTLILRFVLPFYGIKYMRVNKLITLSICIVGTVIILFRVLV